MLVCMFNVMNSEAQILKPDTIKKETKRWYENISIRGYAQARFNRLLEVNPNWKCEQCYKNISAIRIKTQFNF